MDNSEPATFGTDEVSEASAEVVKNLTSIIHELDRLAVRARSGEPGDRDRKQAMDEIQILLTRLQPLAAASHILLAERQLRVSHLQWKAALATAWATAMLVLVTVGLVVAAFAV